MKPLLLTILIIFLLSGCATLQDIKDAQYNDSGRRTSQIFNFPYKKVYDAALNCIEIEDFYWRIVEQNFDDKYIIIKAKDLFLASDYYYLGFFFTILNQEKTNLEIVYRSGTTFWHTRGFNFVTQKTFKHIEQELMMGDKKK